MIKTTPDYMQFSKDELQAYRRRFAKLWDAIPHLTADIEDEEERQALLLVLFLHSLLHAPFGVFSEKNKVSLIDFIDIVPEQSEEMRKVFAQAGGGAIRRIALEKAQKVLELYGFYPTPKAKAPVPRRLFLGKDSHGRARTATFSHLDEDGYARYAIDTNAGNTGLS